jgi:hypothetical protein
MITGEEQLSPFPVHSPAVAAALTQKHGDTLLAQPDQSARTLPDVTRRTLLGSGTRELDCCWLGKARYCPRACPVVEAGRTRLLFARSEGFDR